MHEIAEIFRGGLGRVSEDSRGLAMNVSESTAKRLQQHATTNATRCVHAVEHNMQRLRAHPRRRLRRVQHTFDVTLISRVVTGDDANLLWTHERNVTVAKSRDDLLRCFWWRCEPIAVETLEAVPLNWIVTGGDHHAAIGLECVDHHARSGRHRDADVDDIAARRSERALHCACQRIAADATITRDH